MKKLLLVPVTAAALALSLSACGSDSEDAGGSASGATAPATQPGGGTITGNGGRAANGDGNGGGRKFTPTRREALTKTRECMLKKGYDMPEVDLANPVMVPKNKNGKSDAQVNRDAGECAAQ